MFDGACEMVVVLACSTVRSVSCGVRAETSAAAVFKELTRLHLLALPAALLGYHSAAAYSSYM
jgi:hypothetical protein